LNPDHGITRLLCERIVGARARAALMLGDRIDASTAHSWGLAYQMVDRDALHARAWQIATRLASGPQRVLGATRVLLNRAHTDETRKHIAAEPRAHADVLTHREHIEGMTAFLEHRSPKF
jgi:2-(1,2-epoxy-1,2-dihydrophenyl)acetyl-CoA isomerase